MRWMIGVLAIVAAVPVSAQQVEITLNEAVQRALQVHPAMVEARGDASNADAQRLAALGAFMPSVTVNSSAFRLSKSSIVNGFQAEAGTYQFNSGLTVSLDLFDGLQRVQRYRNAAATVSAADAGYINQRFQVTLSTKQAFYNALAAEELVRVADAQVRRAQQQLQISVDKLHAGSATRSDSLRSTVEYGNARIALLQARADLATAQANLGRQVGIDQSVRAAPDSALPPLPDTTGLRAAALDNSPQVVQAEAQERAAAATVWDRRSQYLPTVSLSYSTSSQGLTEPWQGFGLPNRNQNSLRFSLSWTVFNGFAREQQQTSASVQHDIVKARADDTRRSVNAALTQQLAAMTTTQEKLAISQANVAAATEDLRVQNERYRVGAATILDLLTSQSALTTAEVDLVRARFDYVIARAQVEAVVGRTL